MPATSSNTTKGDTQPVDLRDDSSQAVVLADEPSVRWTFINTVTCEGAPVAARSSNLPTSGSPFPPWLPEPADPDIHGSEASVWARMARKALRKRREQGD